MAQLSIDAAFSAIKRALRDKESSDEIYREAMELTFPDRENFTKRKEGQQKAAYNWDSTPQVSIIRAANRLSSDWTPQFQDWFEIGLGPAALALPDDKFKEAMGGKTKDDMKLELEGITNIAQAIFNGPGFPTASNETYIDWHFGQGGMKIMPNDDILGEPVIFSAMPMSQFYAYEGPNGRHDRWFFWHELRADVITTEWPDAVLPDYIKEEAEKPTPALIKLCSVVYRDYDIGKAGRTRPSGDDQSDNSPPAPFRYEVFWQKGAEKARLVERQSRTPPFVTPRYSKLAGENRGRGPVLLAIPDIRTANKIVELTLRSVAVAVAGVYTATENGVTGAVNIKPYSVIRVRKNGGPDGPSLQRLDNPQRIDFGQLVLDTLHDNIKKMIGDNSLPSEMGPIRSATEFIQRARELVSDQAGGLGRLYSEFIIPAVQRVIDILETKNILATDGLKIDQFLVEIRMTSPLARGEAMQEVENLVRFMEMLKMLGGDELMAYEIDMEIAPGKMADLMNIPMTVRNTVEKKAAFKEALVKQASAQQGGDPNQAGQELANAEQQVAEQA